MPPQQQFNPGPVVTPASNPHRVGSPNHLQGSGEDPMVGTSYMPGHAPDRRAQRRLDEAARAEEARRNARVLAEIESAKDAARAERERADVEHRVRMRQQARAEKDARRATARVRRSARVAAVRGWAGAHVVDLLIYPLALVSAVMAVPAMAAYGYSLYDSATGLALFFITELGMWAFSIAVHVTRHRHPERPVWALQVGVWTFTAAGFGVNFGHGWQATGSVFDGIVMGLASVAGVIAHQLVTASPRRSRSRAGRREDGRTDGAQGSPRPACRCPYCRGPDRGGRNGAAGVHDRHLHAQPSARAGAGGRACRHGYARARQVRAQAHCWPEGAQGEPEAARGLRERRAGLLVAGCRDHPGMGTPRQRLFRWPVAEGCSRSPRRDHRDAPRRAVRRQIRRLPDEDPNI